MKLLLLLVVVLVLAGLWMWRGGDTSTVAELLPAVIDVAEPPNPLLEPKDDTESKMIREVSRLVRDDAGRRRLWVGASSARAVSAAGGPAVFGRSRDVETTELVIKAYGPRSAELGRDVAAALMPDLDAERLVGVAAKGFELALHEDDGRLHCSVSADTATWSGWVEPSGARLSLEGNVVVTSMLGELRSERAAFDVEAGRLSVVGSHSLDLRGKTTEGEGFEGPCSLELKGRR